ncbi:unnamed protein product (macronuclear) [Paramecium tetraurelia]|uniref:Kinesin motor domain-containing protein n=1 Tax=Paramecium tetraurelia TaxID=5888 RepID=A0E0X5_PARTE|nr:uncharacterized protein GSPATT00022110001 [Paramecium tetraurelia]CAK88942.1 unnamed protein product [Paramecium tetraurelia]|eukprot:XP_001456339.1 hypothetical protein (macronuclear) [Paramecium tetraurelia strain d4-2]
MFDIILHLFQLKWQKENNKSEITYKFQQEQSTLKRHVTRPMFDEGKTCIRIDPNLQNTIVIEGQNQQEQKFFSFDNVAGPDTTQEDIFSMIGEQQASNCLEGYNGCVFVYGQTGSGKTYTMTGTSLQPGLLPRIIDYLFRCVFDDQEKDPSVEYLIKCSHLEIYNEHIIDLLNPDLGNLQLREDLNKGVYVEFLTEECCSNVVEAMEVVQRGNENRHISSTQMNFESSRSHSVFTIQLESRRQSHQLINHRFSRFHFVDLAGSERQKHTQVQGERLREGCQINRSLHILGNVINSLVEDKEQNRYVHYRDSKLTFLLKDSLGGNSRTHLIANIQQSNLFYQETLSTLLFSKRVKQVKNKARVNEDESGSLESLKNEIKRLKQELAKWIVGLQTTSKSAESPTKQNLAMHNINFQDINANDQRYIKLEEILKVYLEQSTESETALHLEIEKYLSGIKELREAFQLSSQLEQQLKLIIRLQNEQIVRLKHANGAEDLSNDYQEELSKALLSQAAVMKKFSDSLRIKEGSAKNVEKAKLQITENVQLLNTIVSTVNGSLDERKKLQNQIQVQLSQIYVPVEEFTQLKSEQEVLNERLAKQVEKEEKIKQSLDKIGITIDVEDEIKVIDHKQRDLTLDQQNEQLELKSRAVEQLNQQLIQKGQEIQQIIEQNEKCIQEAHQLNEQIQDSKQEVQQLNQQLQSQQIQLEQAKQQSDSLSNTVNQYQAENERLKQQIILLQNEKETQQIQSNQNLEELNNSLSEQKQQNEALLIQLQKSMQEQNNLINQIHSSLTENSELKEQTLLLTREKQDIELENKKQIDDLLNQIQSLIKQQEQQEQQYQKEIQSFTNQSKIEQINVQKDYESQLQTAVNQHQVEIQQLKNENKRQLDQFVNQQEIEIQTQINQLQNQISQLNTQLSQTKLLLENRNKEYELLKENQDKLEYEIDQQRNEYEYQLEDKQASFQELEEQQKRALEQKEKQLEQQKNDYERRIQQKEAEIQELKLHYEKILEENRGIIKQLEQELLIKKEELNQAVQELIMKEEEYQEQLSQVNEKQKESEDNCFELRSKAIPEKDQTIDQLKADVEQKDYELKIQNEDFMNQQNLLFDIIKQKDNEIIKLQEDLDDHSNRLEEASKVIDKYSNCNSELKGAIDQLNHQLEKQKQIINDLQIKENTSAQILDEKVKSLNEILQSKQSEVDNLQMRLESEDTVIKQQNQQNTKQIQTTEKKIKDLEQENQNYLEELDEKEQCISQLEQKLQTSQKEKEIATNQLTNQIKDLQQQLLSSNQGVEEQKIWVIHYKKEVDKLNKEASLSQQISQQYQSQKNENDQIKLENQKLNKLLDNYQQQISLIKKEIDQAKIEKTKLIDQISQQENKILELEEIKLQKQILQGKVNELQKCQSEALQKYQQSQAQLHTFQDDLQHSKKEIQEIKQKNKVLAQQQQNEMSKFNEEMHAIQEELEQSRKIQMEIKKSEQEQREQNLQLKQNYEKLVLENQQLNNQLDEMQQDINQDKEEILKKDETIYKLSDQVKYKTQQLEAQNSLINQVEQNKLNQTNQILLQSNQLTNLSKELFSLKQQLQINDTQSESYKREVERLRRELEFQIKQVEDYKQQAKKQQQQLDFEKKHSIKQKVYEASELLSKIDNTLSPIKGVKGQTLYGSSDSKTQKRIFQQKTPQKEYGFQNSNSASMLNASFNSQDQLAKENRKLKQSLEQKMKKIIEQLEQALLQSEQTLKEVHEKANQFCSQQEDEIKQIKDQYSRLEQEHNTILAEREYENQQDKQTKKNKGFVQKFKFYKMKY